MNNQEVNEALGRIFLSVKNMGKQSHHPAHEFSDAVETFVDIYRSGARLHPDGVKHRAIAEGWSESDGHDLGETAQTGSTTLTHFGRCPACLTLAENNDARRPSDLVRPRERANDRRPRPSPRHRRRLGPDVRRVGEGLAARLRAKYPDTTVSGRG